MTTANDYVTKFDQSIRSLFSEALRLCLREPAMAAFLYRTLLNQQRAADTRNARAEDGLRVPPFLIASITKRCNLHCKGCYAHAQGRISGNEMSPEQLQGMLEQARDLGVSIVLLAGGEPLARPELLDITAQFPEIIFPLFTNGLLIDDEAVAKLRKQRHVIPVLSLEGRLAETDARRGDGVYRLVLDTMDRLQAAGIFFGTSLTVTSANLEMLTSDAYVRDLRDRGCRLFFYVDYVPVEPGTEHLALNEEQVEAEALRLEALRRTMSALFVAFPGDEDDYGGCLAAGRGFVHISADGYVEPCPFAPYSDSPLTGMSLEEALRSPFLEAIRDSGIELEETHGSCALWTKRTWVQQLLAQHTAAPAQRLAQERG